MDINQKRRIVNEVKVENEKLWQLIQSTDRDIKEGKERGLRIQEHLNSIKVKGQEAERLLDAQKRLVASYSQSPNAKPQKIKDARAGIVQLQRVVDETNKNWQQWRAHQLKGAEKLAAAEQRQRTNRMQLAQLEAEVARRTNEIAQEQMKADMIRAQEAQRRAEAEAARKQVQSRQQMNEKRQRREQERMQQQRQQQQVRPQQMPAPGRPRQQQTRPNNMPVRQMPMSHQMPVQPNRGPPIQAQRLPLRPPVPNPNQARPIMRKPLPPNRNGVQPIQPPHPPPVGNQRQQQATMAPARGLNHGERMMMMPPPPPPPPHQLVVNPNGRNRLRKKSKP